MTISVAKTPTVTISIDHHSALLSAREVAIHGEPHTQVIIVVCDGIPYGDTSALVIADIPDDTDQDDYLPIVQALAESAGTAVTADEFAYLSDRLYR